MKIISNTALISIDIQQGFNDLDYWGPRNNPGFEETAGALIRAWRGAGGRLYHVQHVSREPRSPLHSSRPGVELMSFAQPVAGEPVIQKSVHSAFVENDLEQRLRRDGVERVALFGIATDHCVSTNARAANNLGFEVLVIEDASFTFDRIGSDGRRHPAELVHQVNLASLSAGFARIVHSSELLARARAA